MIEDAKAAYLGAVAAADPTKLVKQHVRRGALDSWLGDLERPTMIDVLAIGKAAPRMLWGLVEAGVPFRGIGVTTPHQKKTHVDTFQWLEGDHPVPGDASADAVAQVLQWVDGLKPGVPVLVLLSGGASACFERGCDPIQWQAWLDDGLDILTMNALRAEGSEVKGGKLGQTLHDAGHPVAVWSLCDVPPAEHRLVGSGPFDIPEIEHTPLADSSLLGQAAGSVLQSLGYEVFARPERLHTDVADELAGFITELGPGQALVGHGEPTVALPTDAPPGGRCCHAALLAAAALPAGHLFLAGASDGHDGTSGQSMAWTLAGDQDADAGAAASRAAALDWLDARDRCIGMGDTGTNLNDVWILVHGLK